MSNRAANCKAVIGVLGPMVSARRLDRMRATLDQRNGHVHVCLENVNNAENGAAVCRSMDGFGLLHLHAIERYGRRLSFVEAISRGSERWLELHAHDTTWTYLENVSRAGGTVISTGMSGVALNEVDFERLPKPWHIVFGNEQRGVSKLMATNSAAVVTLPSIGMVQSYNVSAAAAMLFMHMWTLGLIGEHRSKSKKRDKNFRIVCR
jgi:tRNA (guanosine-2'-O-)-methyltransferase